MGNIYADESLWLSPPPPGADPPDAAEAARLYAAIREVMAAAVEAGGSSLGSGVGNYRQHDGLSGLFQHQHHVYGRAGQPCDRCGTGIVKTVLAQRGTHHCPQCQPLRPATGAGA